MELTTEQKLDFEVQLLHSCLDIIYKDIDNFLTSTQEVTTKKDRIGLQKLLPKGYVNSLQKDK